MALSVGKIGLDLVVNQKDFNKQMVGITGLAKKAGSVLAAAFAVNKLVKFSKECLELGSDLAEVQNVVDVTFPQMTKRVDDFAKSAAASFGLSETMAKKFTGTFGTMAKSFGFSEQAAYDMGTSLSGLAGDIASFYNISQEEAYTKLKSVFTGETETLKDLGVVMTQTALDSYALSNGFGKTTAKMTEAEKVALRYKFVQEQLSAASGDFLRTSDGWANQVRILSLQFDSLKATLGQGLINVFTPIIKVINTLMAKLVQLAGVFKSFTESIMGKKSEESAAGLSDAEVAAGGVTEHLNEAGKSAKKLKSLLPTDELTLLNGGNNGSDSAGSTEASFNMPEMQTAASEMEKSTENIAAKMQKIFSGVGIDRFVKKFNKGISKIDFSSIQKNFKRIIPHMESISKTAVDNIQKIWEPLAGLIGSSLGNAIAIGAKVFDIGLDSMATYLENNTAKINEWSTEVSSSIAAGLENLTYIGDTLSDVVLGALEQARPEIVNGINDLFSGFTGLGMSIGTIISDSFEIATEKIEEWVSANKEYLQNTLAEFLALGGEFVSLFGQIAGDIGNSLTSWWEEKGSSTFAGITEVLHSVMEVLLRLWNEVLMPVFEKVKDEMANLWDSSLKPLWDNILNFISSLGDFLAMLWNQILKPAVDYIIDTVGPTVKGLANIIISVFGTIFSFISDTLSGIIKALGGVLDFLTGIFTGDWEKAWNGIKDFFDGIWEAMWASTKAVINLIIDGINTLIALVYDALRNVINGVGDLAGTIGDLLGKDWEFSVPADPPQIPKLANGGYVKPNTPQLAMIGDNRHQGEVVSPENKLQEMADKAVKQALSVTQSLPNRQLDKIIQLLNLLIELVAEGKVVEVNGVSFGRVIRKINEEWYNTTGEYLLEV